MTAERRRGGDAHHGRLLIVGTPIGNLGDLSPRAAEALATADVIACEDTRHTGMLLSRNGIDPRRLISLHEHNEASRTDEVIGLLDSGATVALVSDAGMPVVSDPGARIVAAAAEAGHEVVVVPGPSAGVAAYAVSGLATGRYVFEGFLPRRGPERRERIGGIARSSCPSIIFESPVRVAQTLDDLARACGRDRCIAICRELTKMHEEVWRGTLGEAVARSTGGRAVGEHVIVVAGSARRVEAGPRDMEELLRHHLGSGMSRRDAVAATAGELEVSRRAVYDIALRLPLDSDPASVPGQDVGVASPVSPSSGEDALPDVPSNDLAWTDSHCHVHGGPDPVAVLERARSAGVGRVVCIGTGEIDSRSALDFAARQWALPAPELPEVYATIGLHPHDAKDGTGWVGSMLAEEGAGSGEPSRLVGIGECGLDYHYDHSPRDVQRTAFAEQIELAHKHDLPLVVHTREAWDDTFSLLDQVGVPGRLIFHCFTGGPQEAARCLELGAFLSFSGIVTFKKAADVQGAAEMCPLDRMLLETDSPYLAPIPHRGEQNEPTWLPLVGAAIARLKAVPVAEIASATYANTERVFRLGRSARS